jgi:hypothetical protein
MYLMVCELLKARPVGTPIDSLLDPFIVWTYAEVHQASEEAGILIASC